MPSYTLLRRRRPGTREAPDRTTPDRTADRTAGAGPQRRLRRLAYLALGLPVGLLALVILGTLTTPLLMACTRPADISSWEDAVRRAALLTFGILLTVGVAPLAAAPLAALERRRLRVLAPAPTEPGDPEPRPGAVRLRARYTTARAWREVAAGYLVAVAGPGLVLLAATWVVLCSVWLAAPLVVARSSGGPVALGIGHARSVPDALPYCAAGLAAGILGIVVLTTLVRAQAALSRTLVEPRPDPLATRLVEVTRSRSRLADGFAAERRRIERDLHDGAQQQLLGLTLQLGLARMDLPADSPAGQAVARAHDQAKTLMADLRELIRGIHPQVLTDRGLGAALYELAEFCPLPVHTDIDLPHRPPQAVETAAYFAAAEALANALRHSAADTIRLTARVRHGRLTVDVEDDGRGGARLADGTGLTGLADRVAVVDGTIRVSSPPGGPTLVRVTIPCPPHSREDDR
ncbi:sensor histidine kinase [Embleya scabrispora]|nr:sensor histidine kinase [Embleya scabrispora]